MSPLPLKNSKYKHFILLLVLIWSGQISQYLSNYSVSSQEHDWNRICPYLNVFSCVWWKLDNKTSQNLRCQSAFFSHNKTNGKTRSHTTFKVWMPCRHRLIPQICRILWVRNVQKLNKKFFSWNCTRVACVYHTNSWGHETATIVWKQIWNLPNHKKAKPKDDAFSAVTCPSRKRENKHQTLQESAITSSKLILVIAANAHIYAIGYWYLEATNIEWYND